MYREKAFNRPVFKPSGKTKTDQSFKKDCDVNVIVAKFMKTGQISHINKRQGFYADVSEIPDLLGAQQILRDAEQAFADLPATVRKRFGNSPEALLEFLSDENNREEAIKMGLIPEAEKPAVSDIPSTSTVSKNSKTSKSKAEPKTTTTNDDDQA